MKTLVTALAVTAMLATSAVAKTPRTKEVRVQRNNAVSHNAVTRSPIHTAASIAGRPILTAESSSSFTATVGTGNSTRPSDIGFSKIRLTTSNRQTRGAVSDLAASG